MTKTVILIFSINILSQQLNDTSETQHNIKTQITKDKENTRTKQTQKKQIYQNT
jgi:hypothetical protein